MMRFIVFTGFVLLNSLAAMAQHRIQGNIQDEQGAPLLFANVLLLTETKEFVKGEVADVDGNFSLNDIATGSYILTLSTVGYEAFRRVIQVDKDLNLGVLTVTTDNVALEEVTVTAQKVAYVRKADRTVVNVGSLPTAAGSNALELLAPPLRASGSSQ